MTAMLTHADVRRSLTRYVEEARWRGYTLCTVRKLLEGTRRTAGCPREKPRAAERERLGSMRAPKNPTGRAEQ